MNEINSYVTLEGLHYSKIFMFPFAGLHVKHYQLSSSLVYNSSARTA
jgi:hypothetical protein